MSFTVEDFHDLMELLGQHPEWRAELRRQVLSEELLEMPGLFRGLTERVDRLGERLEQLAEAQLRTEERLERVEAAIEQLTGRLGGVQQDLGEVKSGPGRVQQDLGDMKGMVIEDRFRRRPLAFIGRMMRLPVALTDEEVARLVEPALRDGRLSLAEQDELIRADAVIRGEPRHRDGHMHLVAEVSWGIGFADVERAARRASILARAGIDAGAIVVGESISGEAERAVELAGVGHIIDRGLGAMG